MPAPCGKTNFFETGPAGVTKPVSERGGLVRAIYRARKIRHKPAPYPLFDPFELERFMWKLKNQKGNSGSAGGQFHYLSIELGQRAGR